MDEIDGIIVKALKEIGCEIGGEIVNLSCFSPELIVETISKCLRVINPSIFVPNSLPSIIIHRYSVASSLVEACMLIGYDGDIGYYTFLYSNVSEIRKLYMFLIEMLPKENYGNIERKRFLIMNLHINNAFALTWIPCSCRILMQIRTENYLNPISKERLNFWLKKPSSLFHSLRDYKLSAALVSIVNFKTNQEDLVEKWSRSHKACFKIVFNNDEIKHKNNICCRGSKATKASGNQSILKIKKQIEILKSNIKKHKLSIEFNLANEKCISKKLLEMQDFLCLKENKMTLLKHKKKKLQRACIIIDDHSKNISKMEEIICATKNKKIQLNSDWNKNRWPMIQTLDTMKLNKNSCKKVKNLRKKLRSIQEQCFKMKEEIQVKSALHSIFSQELKKIGVFSQRNTYTARIMEIIENIRKQNSDIHKVIHDTNEVKKRITAISGILDRQFTITDDALYNMAKKNDYTKKAYKLLAGLHLYCSEIIILVKSTGNIIKEVREFEENIEQEKLRKASLNLKRVKYDLNKIEKESTTNKIKIC